MNSRNVLISLFILLSLSQTGCIGVVMGVGRLVTGGQERRDDAQVSYHPAIQLTESPRTIDARVRLETFENHIPTLNPKHSRGGEEVTVSLMEGTLSDLVQQAVLGDFRTNLVYASIRTNEEHPDLVINGHIYRFSEYRSKPWYAKIPLVGRLFGDSEHIEGGVSLDLMISAVDGLLIGIYSGEARFTSDESLPRNQWAPGKPLNRVFTEAIRQIRTKMLDDDQLVNGEWRTITTGPPALKRQGRQSLS